MRILITEDNDLMCRMMVQILSRYGMCDSAQDGQDALFKYKRSLDFAPYDIIILDIMMPKMNGYQVLEEIRKIEKENNIKHEDRTIIVIMSALIMDNNIEQAMHLGCDEYLCKPINIQELENVLEKYNLY